MCCVTCHTCWSNAGNDTCLVTPVKVIQVRTHIVLLVIPVEVMQVSSSVLSHLLK